jgi:hypothetical protein
VVLILAGLGWLTASVTGLLLPAYAQAVGPFVRVVTAGEMVFMLWLVIRGARVPESTVD